MTAPPATRVVVADDSGLMRRVLAHALTDAGFDVVGQAADGDEAQLDAVPAAGSASIEAIAKIDDRLVILLDPEGIFAGADAPA